MSIDSNVGRETEISRMLDRLVNEFGYADAQAAMAAALANLIEDLESRDETDEEDDWPAIKVAVDEYLQGAVCTPIDEVFAELRKRHNLPPE